MNEPLKFPGAAQALPIVGQPFTLKGGYPTALIQCNCDAHEPVILIGGNPGACQVCGRMFVIASFSFAASTGQIQIQVGLVRPEPPIGVPS